MRRDGKTTRTVDEAIQAIFKPENKGLIIVPHLDRNNEAKVYGFKKDQVFIDPDAEYGNHCQDHLRDTIIRRLLAEHRGFITNKNHEGSILIKPRH